MKKNVMMRIASILLVCVLATTCGISGTYAKYVTSDFAEDSARVAKWGVKIEANFDGLFTRGYKEASVESTDNQGEASVWADAEVGVVAPGTAGSLADFVVTGTPEVDVRVNYSAVVELTGQWLDEEGDFYCPLKITIEHESTTVVLCGLDYASADAFETAIQDNIAALTKKYEAGQNMDVINDDLSVSWRWDFEADPAAGLVNKQTDLSDTFLGDWILNYPTEAPTISVKVTCTITQVD